MAASRPEGVQHDVPRPRTPEPEESGSRTNGAHRAWSAIRRHRQTRSRGQALVELALVTPILLILLLAAIDLGRVFYAEIAVANAAREAAMVASTNPTGFTSGAACNAATNPVMCAATHEAQGGNVTIGTADVAMTCAPSCAVSYGTKVTVTVTGHFQLLTPLMAVFTGGSNVSFSKTATADVIVTPAAAGLPTPTATATPTPTPTGATPTPTSAPTPTPTASPTPTPTCPPPLVIFTSSQSDKNGPVSFTSSSTPTSGSCAISYWRWDFGDNKTFAGGVPTTTHDYGNGNKGKTYLVTLTVTTPNGTFSYQASITTLPA